MIKIFRGGGGGRGGDTFKTPSPYEQVLPLPTPCFKMVLERSLNDPTTPLQTSFTATLPPCSQNISKHYFSRILQSDWLIVSIKKCAGNIATAEALSKNDKQQKIERTLVGQHILVNQREI